LDTAALILALLPLSYPYEILYDYSLLDPLASGLGFAAFVTSAGSLVTDLHAFMTFPTP
jgi:hypothetical protein